MTTGAVGTPGHRADANRSARPRWRGVFLVLVMLLLTACGTALGGEDGATAPGARLEGATFLADPHDYQGPSTARLAETGVDAVAEDPERTLPVTVTDAQGTEVTIHDTSRILAIDLYGTTSRVVFELGLGDSIVGRDTSSAYAEILDRPLVTQNGHELNGEAILELAPTVIITDSSLGPWDVILQMREAGIPVVVVDSHRSMDNVDDIIMLVAESLGVPEQGTELAARTTTGIEAMVGQVAEVAPQGDEEGLRIVFLYVRGQSGIYYMFGTGSGTDSLIEALGGVDVATEIGWNGMKPMTDEGLVEAAPDLVLMMTKGLESTGGVDGLLEAVPALAHTPAGQNRRIVDMDDTEILSFGPHTAAVLEALAVAIYAPESAAEPAQ